MIKSFKNKGLKKFFETGNTAKIRAEHAKKLRLILAKIDSAEKVSDTDFPGADLHPLKGNRSGVWSISVNGPWRVTFKFEDGDAYILDYEQYH